MVVFASGRRRSAQRRLSWASFVALIGLETHTQTGGIDDLGLVAPLLASPATGAAGAFDKHQSRGATPWSSVGRKLAASSGRIRSRSCRAHQRRTLAERPVAAVGTGRESPGAFNRAFGFAPWASSAF
jgi:hypothetical protein